MRILCNASEDYFTCERVWNSDLFKIGNIHNGIDTENALRLSQYTAFCGHCKIKHICRMCPAQLFEKEGNIDFVQLKEMCEVMNLSALENLQIYTSILENNPQAFDDIIEDAVSISEWFKNLEYVQGIKYPNFS